MFAALEDVLEDTRVVHTLIGRVRKPTSANVDDVLGDVHVWHTLICMCGRRSEK